jgi:hypothetical protein
LLRARKKGKVSFKKVSFKFQYAQKKPQKLEALKKWAKGLKY